MLTAIARGIGSTRAGQAFSDYVKYGKRLAPHQAAIIDRLPAARNVMALGGSYLDASQILYTGEKFAGGWGLNRDYEIVNLHEVRRHSLELWRSNPIAVSIFGRLETKIINDGLRLEALPEARFLGFNDNSPELQEWTDDAEGYMGLYADDAKLVDERGRFNLYQLQRQAYSTAKLSGDCLVIRRIDPLTFMPRIQLVDGKHIETPFEFSMGINPSTGRQVINGVEIEANGSETGYWVRTAAFKPGQNNVFNLGYQFVDAFGKNSGRRRANLVYGSRLRVDEYRGMPLLAHAMQMLKQIDRTLDNAQLAMALDAQVVLSIVTDVKAPQSASNMVGNGPLQKTAARTATVNIPQEDGTNNALQASQFTGGMIYDKLKPGTKIESHNTRHPNPDVAKAVLFGMQIASASCEVPPEIALLMFNSNFSASRQAVNEFDAIRRKELSNFNPAFNNPIYEDILIGLDMSGRLITPGLFESIRDNDRITFNAWTHAAWSSTQELSVDMLKNLNMLLLAIKNGLVTHEWVALKFFGTRFKKVVAKLLQENKALAEANTPLQELENLTANQPAEPPAVIEKKNGG